MSSPDPAAELAAIFAVDVTVADPTGCATVLGATRRLRGFIDQVEAGVTRRMIELHEEQGAAPAADVHARTGGVSSAEGKRKERRSKTLDEAPSFEDALGAGEIGAEHVDALANATAKLDDDVKDQLFDRESDLLDDARRLSPEEFGRSVRDLARAIERDNGIERATRQRKSTFLSRKTNTATGLVEGRFAFHPELASKVFGPVDRHVSTLIKEGAQAGDPECVDRSVDRNRLAAEALGELVASGNQNLHPGTADATAIVDATALVTGEIDDDTVCETGDGNALPPAAVSRMICNGQVTPILVDADRVPLAAGRTVRHANRAQRRALRAMYRTCGFGDCDVAFDRCEMHHIVPWEHGGSTDLDNLIPLCSRHHHVVHEGDWALELAPDRTLTTRQPDGRVFTVSEPDVPPQRRRRRTVDEQEPAPAPERVRERQPAA
ncbi:HNH endonuclease signature motif containing protein [Ilumatobacter fluminis]|nr:HNH endonuclease signature motif containing protein [Ilumatobacter fluminis]